MADANLLRRIAVDAACDPRSVKRYLTDPTPMRPTVRERIENALEDRGLSRLVRPMAIDSSPRTHA